MKVLLKFESRQRETANCSLRIPMKNQMLKVSKLSNDGKLLWKERETGNEHGEWQNKNKTKQN